MRGSPSDDQLFLRDSVRDLAKGLKPDSAWRTLEASGFTDLCTPDAGSSTLDVAIVVESLAEVLCPSPFIGSAIFATSLRTLAGIGPMSDPTAVALDSQLQGLLRLNDDAGVAWDCVPGSTVYALGSDGRTVVAGSASTELGERFDLDRPCCDVEETWEPVGEIEPDAQDRWLAGALISLAAELCGMMSASLSTALDYARDRRQFGQPIGSFQAVQHLLAAGHVAVESVRSAVYAAADMLDAEGSQAGLAMARIAKSHASDRAIDVIEMSLQVHGGIGMTWEFPGHRYLRRAWLDAVTLGDASHHRRLVGASLLAAASEGHHE